MLCMVLIAVSSAASSVRAMHHLEHQWDAAVEHDHGPFNQVTVAVAGMGEAGDEADLDGSASTGHHHQGDGHSNLLILNGAGLHIDWNESPLGIAAEQSSPGMPVLGPERPPKHLTVSL